MKKCWDHSPETRPMAEEIYDCLLEYASKNEIIELAETKRQEIIKSDKFLIDTKNYKHHPESYYTSRLLNKSIQQAESLLNLSSTEIQMNNRDNSDDENSLSVKKNYKNHSEQFYTSCSSSVPTQQVELSNLSSTGIGSKTHYIEDDDDDNGLTRKKSKTFHKQSSNTIQTCQFLFDKCSWR